jgi:DNA-binding NarL/FixJ family response regulator
MPVIRILLVDDHPIVRAGLRAVLEAEDDLAVVAESSDPDEGVRLARAGDVDVVLMDLQFDGQMRGAEATRAIAAYPDGPRVLVLTTYDTDTDILAAIEAGAAGYLLKDAPPQQLAAAVRTAASGQSALAPTVATRLMTRMRQPATNLSGREVDVLRRVAAGRSNQQIATDLLVSQATVKTHLVHIFGKLGVDSRTEAVAAAVDQGLLRR